MKDKIVMGTFILRASPSNTIDFTYNYKKRMFMITQNKRLIGIVLTVGILLLIPLIAMQFTNEVKWDSRDFIIMGVLLLGTGLMCELVMRKVKKIQHRVLLIATILVALFLIWAELAVGIFGTPFAGS